MGYSIKDAAERIGLSTYSVRYYEQEGLLPDIGRDPHGNRVFTDRDLEWLGFIGCLRETGMSIAEIRSIADLTQKGDATIPERMQILERHKQMMELKMAEMQQAFRNIDCKMKWYESQAPTKKGESDHESI